MTEWTVGEETITTFKQAVERTSAIAHAKLPKDLHGALERATALVLHRHVWLGEDGRHAHVLSSDGQTWYRVNGACTCMDAPKALHGYCEHKLAVQLYKRAGEVLTASCARVQPQAAAGLPLPEAPASANVRVLIEGREVQVTLRDTDEGRLLTRLAPLLARYPAACGGKGTGKGDAPAQTTGETPTCPYHGGMRESTKVKGTFYCPSRMGDGTFCKEKFPKK